MISIQQFVAAFLAYSLGPAHPAVLGIVTQSEKASMPESAVSEGTTIYDGDCLSTEAGGVVSLRLQAANAQLGSESRVTFRASEQEKTPAAELASGTLVFSSSTVEGIEVLANEARIRLAENGSTIASVGVVNPKELRISVRRGSLDFSYGDERAVISEGTAYRVLLDSAIDDPASDSGKTKADKKSPAHRTFRLVMLGAAAAPAVWGVINALKSPQAKRKHPESPDKP